MRSQDSPASRSSYPRRFGPRFTLLKELGKGGMGHVFMALTGQAGVERVCALKILKEVRAGRDAEELTQRFLDEAKVVTKLSHENLVYVFDFGIHERQGYLAMEYVQGKSITETWNRCAAKRDGFPIGLSLYYIAELVSALWYAANVDGLGLVHRDISPSNVMLTYTGGVKLIDFGLAKWKAKVVQTAAGVQWGKTSYMSPDQYLGKPVDHRSDLFSAGVILWELLTGRQMFPPSETRLPTAAIPPPSQFTRDVTPGLDRVVSKALAIHAADRFQTGEEMSAALLAEMPSEPGGKLQAAKFIGRLFEAEIRDEMSDQRQLVERAANMDVVAPREPSDSSRVGESINEGETTPDPDPDGLIGKTLSDRYYVRRLVGEGAMGRVYEGHHTGIGKRVAIKIAHQVERRKSEVAKRFQREALAPAQIGHPNVADVTDCGTTPTGEFFFVMEFIDGVSLDAVIKRDGQLSIERALTIAGQICRALEAAHRAGIIHRDLKPSNVMLVRSQDQEELVKVLDFGVAKFLHDTGDGANLTLTDATVGTPKYMAPEQIRGGGKVDFRADIYALGAILYTMLAGGRMPIEGATVDEIWQRKLTRDPRPLHEYRSDLPPD
ncbi:MAG TPA: serine/threonine-protein kinase, partial [Polyangia bacterium]